ncbi:MAG: sensor histidine kinase [Chloroflexota bacterium]
MKVRRPLHTKLFASYLVVVVVGAVTLLLVMLLVTPLIYARALEASMMGMMGSSAGGMGAMMAGMNQATQEAVNQVFRETVFYSLVVSAVTSLGAAVLASLFVSRRLVRPIQQLSAASQRIAAGHYAERVEQASGDEVESLAYSFNQMAASLEETERRRLTLIADVAHELRTPLASIEGYAEGLLDGVVEPAPETFALLHTEADRLRRLVDDLQELSRAEARQLPLQAKPVPPERLLRTVAERLAPQFADKGVELQVGPASNLPAVLADEGRALQVLTNLLSNALRYTAPGGRVAVAARRRGEAVAFEVVDTGVGIAAEHLPHLFERFYRADRSRSRSAGGSGIGLTIAKHLVEAQGGTIEARSAGIGLGSTFVFTLPLAR